MARIKNEDIYPIKEFPVQDDFIIGTDSEDGGKSVSFKFSALDGGTTDYVENVTLQGTTLVFTGIGSAMNTNVQLTKFVTVDTFQIISGYKQFSVTGESPAIAAINTSTQPSFTASNFGTGSAIRVYALGSLTLAAVAVNISGTPDVLTIGSGINATGFYSFTVNQRGDVVANSFTGDASGLTNLPVGTIDTSLAYNWTGNHDFSGAITSFNSVITTFDAAVEFNGSSTFQGVINAAGGIDANNSIIDNVLTGLDPLNAVNNTTLNAAVLDLGNTAVHKIIPSNFDFESIPLGYDNSTWVIKYDFDLATATATLPANVTLQFEGGSISNGSMVFNNTTITYGNIEAIFDTVVLTGTLTNNVLDSRLFGMLPNDNTVDCTVIYNTYLASLDLGLYFSKGNYYMTEWHVTKDNFRVEADRHTDIECLVTFHPFNNTQYYIMKLGGGKFTLNDDSAHIKNTVISHIHFFTPIGYAPQALTDFAGTSTAGIVYKNSALVIDKCQVGRFAINGNTLHNTPLLSIGASYELHFDYITMYGNHGKSDLPVIQLLPDFAAPTQGYISASIIEKIMVEVFVGSIWKESDNCGINEILINDVIVEGTIEWEAESITSENRFTRLTKTLPDYYTSGVNLVPMFEINAVSNIIVNTLTINATDTEWQNSLDPSPLGFNTRSLCKFGTQESEIQINNIINGGLAQNFYLHGAASEVYRNKLNINRANEDTYFFNDVTGGFDLTTNNYNNKVVKLINEYEYLNDDLSELLNTNFVTNIGLSNNLTTIDEDKYTKVLNSRWDNYMISKEGFYVDTDIIEIVGKIATTQSAIDIEYYDAAGTLLSTQVTTFGITPNVLFTNTLELTKPVGYSYLKLVQKSTGFLAKTYSIKATDTPAGSATQLRVDNTGRLVITDAINQEDYNNKNDEALLKARGTEILSGGLVTFVIGEITFNVSATVGQIKNATQYFPINFAGQSGITLTTPSAMSTWVYIDTAGTIQQQTTEPTLAEYRTKLFLTRLATTSNTLRAQEANIGAAGQYTNQIRDLVSYLPSLKKGLTLSGNADRTFQTSAGSIFEMGAGFEDNPLVPNVKSFLIKPTTSFFYVTRDTTISTAETLVNNTQYDLNGTLTTMTNNRFRVDTVFYFNSGNVVVQIGQNQYTSLDAAETSISTRTFVRNPVVENGTRIGWIIVGRDFTDLTDPATTRIKNDAGSISTSSTTTGALLAANNLSDLDDVATAITNLGLAALFAPKVGDTLVNASVVGAFPLDWNLYSAWLLTINNGALTLSDTNLPALNKNKVITIYFNVGLGTDSVVVPAYWTKDIASDDFDGTKVNRFTVECVSGGSGTEIVKYSITNIT